MLSSSIPTRKNDSGSASKAGLKKLAWGVVPEFQANMIAENSRLGNKNFTDNFFYKNRYKGNSTSIHQSWKLVVTDDKLSLNE